MMGTHYVFLWQTSNNQVAKDTLDNTGSPVKLGAFYAWINHRLMLWTKMSEGKEKQKQNQKNKNKQQMSKETFGHLERLENCPKLQEAVCLKEQDIQNPDDSRLLHSYKPEIQPLNWTLQDVTERTYCSSDTEANSTCCSNSLYEGQPIRRKLFTTSPFISESERRSGTKTRC